MPSTDLVTRTKETVALIDHPQFVEQVEALLPDTLPVKRFVQVAKTAIRSNPDLVTADQPSLFGALIRCAQDSLVPDNHEAALVLYGDKVSYLPMIGGVRKRLAEYGWTLKTRVVYSEDDFSYSEEPQQLRHVPVRPGAPRGERVAAYAVATHRDGRRLQIVLDAAEIEKRKAKARSKNVWNEWPDAMWEKSAGHAIFDEIPRAERDRMTVPADNGVDDAVELLYGPNGDQFTALEAPADPPSGDEPTRAATEAPTTDNGGEPQQAEPDASLAAGSAPGTDDDEPQPEWVDVGRTVVKGGNWNGKTLAQLAASEKGREWLAYALANPGKFDPNFHENLAIYVEGALPELWAAHTEKSAA
jgi:recombination protein RecT